MALSPNPAPENEPRQWQVPIVRRPNRQLPLWLGGAAIALIGGVLFVALEAHRAATLAPAVQPGRNDVAATPETVPPLYVPPVPANEPQSTINGLPRTAPNNTMLAPPQQPPLQPHADVNPPQRIVRAPHFRQQLPFVLPAPPLRQQPPIPMEPPRAQRLSTDPALVYDASGSEPVTSAGASGDGEHPTTDTNAAASPIAAGPSRVGANTFRHRATTVPQGTLIAAVLETALDSTRPGLARALVTRDVYGFDGSRILIPRGSRLVGEYKGDLAPGQKRTLILWTRLTRPDGATIALASPTSDPLGRIGVKGKVNNHFLTRLGTALLQTSLSVGVALAGRSSNSGVVLALPGAVQGATSPLTSGAEMQPTLSVRQGTSIAVFVARDLDFSSVEARR